MYIPLYTYIYLEPKCPSFLKVIFLIHPLVQKTSFGLRGVFWKGPCFETTRSELMISRVSDIQNLTI